MPNNNFEGTHILDHKQIKKFFFFFLPKIGIYEDRQHRSLILRMVEGKMLFNDALNTFYLRLYGVRHMVKDHSDSEKGNMGYAFRLAARVLLYAPSHRQDNTYHGLCYTSRGALAGTRNSSMGPPNEGSIRRPIAPWANALATELHLAPRENGWCIIGNEFNDQAAKQELIS